MERDARPHQLSTFFSTEALAPGARIALDDGEARHVRVLRLTAGERVRLVDGAGRSALGTLALPERGRAAVAVDAVIDGARPPDVHLLVPVADRERMLWLAEKATELSATSWRTVRWRRSRSVAPRGEGGSFREKLARRMAAALTQSGGLWLPALQADAEPDEAVASAPAGCRLLLDAAGAPVLASTFSAPVTLAVGPEGGLEPEERAALVAAGFLPVQLAPLTLRFETAALAGLAIARAALSVTAEGRDG